MAGLTISTAVSGRVYLVATNNPVTITSTGSVTTTTSNDAISGGSGTPWAISNFGTISGIIGSSSAGIYLQGAGSSVQNSGTIYGNAAGIWLSDEAAIIGNVGDRIGASQGPIAARIVGQRLKIAERA